MPVTVVTAASGQYETQLMAEMGKSEAPTLFQVNGPVGLANWKDYCYDLSGSALYGELTSDDFALKDADAVYGIAYVIETYGIIVNKALLEQAGHSMDEITDFAALKAVAEDITARKDELGFSAFTSAGMDGSSDWRFKTHLANLPIYYEYEAEGVHADAINGTYLDNYRAIWDLYINNATCAPAELSAKTGDDAVAEFVRAFCLRSRRPYSPTTGCYPLLRHFSGCRPSSEIHRSVFPCVSVLLRSGHPAKFRQWIVTKSYGFLCTPLRLRTNHPYDNHRFDHAGERAVPNRIVVCGKTRK